MLLPLFKHPDQAIMLLQTKWKSVLDPILKNLLNQSVQLTDIQLRVGDTVFNHTLGRTPVGWVITDSNGAANIFRSKPFNDKTLTLSSSASVVVSVLVY